MQIESGRNFGHLACSIPSRCDQAASAAHQISGMVALGPPNLPLLNVFIKAMVAPQKQPAWFARLSAPRSPTGCAVPMNLLPTAFA